MKTTRRVLFLHLGLIFLYDIIYVTLIFVHKFIIKTSRLTYVLANK